MVCHSSPRASYPDVHSISKPSLCEADSNGQRSALLVREGWPICPFKDSIELHLLVLPRLQYSTVITWLLWLVSHTLASASTPHSHPFPFLMRSGLVMKPKLSLASPFSCLHQSPECWDCVCAPVPAALENWCRIIIIFLSLSGSILSTHQLHLLFFWANCYSLVCTLLTPRSVFQCQELKCVKLRFSNDTYCFVLGVVWFALFPESWVYWPHPGESWPAEHLYAKVRWPAEGT